MTAGMVLGSEGGVGTLVAIGFSDLSVSVSDESLLLEPELLELVADLASPMFGLGFLSSSVTEGSVFFCSAGDGGFTGGLDASVSDSDSDELSELLLELLDDFFICFIGSSGGSGALCFCGGSSSCSSVRGIRFSDFSVSDLAVSVSDSLEELLDEDEDDFFIDLATTGGDGLFLGGVGTFFSFSDSDEVPLEELLLLLVVLETIISFCFKARFFSFSESESELLDLPLETEFEKVLFLAAVLSESDSELLFFSFVSFASDVFNFSFSFLSSSDSLDE